MLLADAFKYKKWANAELLALGECQLSQMPDSDAEFFVRILNHTTVVDSLFISRLCGEAERYQGDNTRETPTFDELKARIAQNDAWLVDFAERATADELQRVIAFRFTDGDLGQLSVEEVLLHLLTHGSNHRGMAARTLAINGLERPKDTFTRYLHQAEPGRRELAREAIS
ncbi:putative damage-inducible protein DinB [Pseudomonas sp. URMO17WK12:I1]|uniref:DinB family protein n=1 Tax=unclassified Pseudomonas TaxID=196821 RepID=UPI000483BFD6|nr:MULTISPECIES: DinB family protein [unclassified Pseudomonas]PZW68577.1 putative damage-inducible protein DinB [Pseudomonas sp. URMO17WK12:I1]